MTTTASDNPESVIDLNALDDASKGHRQLDDIWQYFKKIKLDLVVAKARHRNYDGQCKTGGSTVAGKPQVMRKRTSTCTSTSHTGQLHALHEQAKQRLFLPKAPVFAAVQTLGFARVKVFALSPKGPQVSPPGRKLSLAFRRANLSPFVPHTVTHPVLSILW